jgi:sodium/hydrogen antiporter
MSVLLYFSLMLLAAALLSELARRTILSTAVLFLAAGIVASAMGILHFEQHESSMQEIAQLVLISVLFTDGLKVEASEVLRTWRLSARALLVGLPLTVAGIALCAVVVAKLSWSAGFIVGAALSPTTPIFAAALFRSEKVPMRLRRMLSIESSVSEGLALPILLAELGWIGASGVKAHVALLRLLLGVGIGVAVPWAAALIQKICWLATSEQYEPIFPVAVIGVVFGLSELVHANEFIAAAAAGVTLATISPRVARQFTEMGEWVSELLKLAALLIFGGFFSIHVWREVGAGGIWFAVLAILLVRPAAMAIALWRSELTVRERIAAAWFGPKGFASVLFGLLILEMDLPNGHAYFELIALTIVASIVAHSSTDVLVAKWFVGEEVRKV